MELIYAGIQFCALIAIISFGVQVVGRLEEIAREQRQTKAELMEIKSYLHSTDQTGRMGLAYLAKVGTVIDRTYPTEQI
jgi:hypothetical protein